MSILCKSLLVPVRKNWLKQAGRLLASLLLIAFARAQAPNNSQDPAQTPEPVRTTITVVESIATETPAFVTVLDNTEIRQQPGVNIDDRLRSIPGFTLF